MNSKFYLDHDLPVIQLSAQNETLDQVITLTCLVVGYPIPLVQFMKNGSPITSILSNHSHTFKTKSTDTGNYTCKSINHVAEIETKLPAQLTVFCKLFVLVNFVNTLYIHFGLRIEDTLK